MTGHPVMPGVPAAGHVTSGGFWHPGRAEGCVKCESPRTFVITRSMLARCPKKSLLPSHFYDDGHCRCTQPCVHCAVEVRWHPGGTPGVSGGWCDVSSTDVAILGSGFLCSERHGGHEVEGWSS